MEFSREDKGRQGGRLTGAFTRLFAGLRFRLLALILLVAIPALALTLFTHAAWRQHETEEAGAYALMLARLAAGHQEQVIQASHELLLGLSRVPAVHRSDPACSQFLTTLRSISSSYANFAVVRLDGNISCEASHGPGPKPFTDSALFRRVVQTREFVLGGRRVDEATGKVVMQFAAPILDSAGRVQAVGFGGFDMKWLGELMAEPLWPAGATVTLIDREGFIAAREPNPEDWVGQSAADKTVFHDMRSARGHVTTIGSDLDGAQKLFAFTPLRGPMFNGGLLLAVGLPLAPVLGMTNSILARNLVALGGTCILVIAVAWAGSNLLVLRRVKTLVGMARRLSAGDLTTRSGVSQGAGELDQLADAFDTMAARLEERQTEAEKVKEALRHARDELERRVKERTADLAKANATLEGALRDLRQTEEHIRRDITERRQGEEALRKLSRALEQTAECVCITDRSGVIEYVNPAFERQTGYAAAEAIGRKPSILKSGQHGAGFYEELWSTILSGEVFRGIFTNKKKHGELYYDLQTISPVRNEQGDISHFVASGRDITRRMRTEEALLRLNAQLEREAERIAHALHDEAGQYLTTAHIVLAEVARELPPAAQHRLLEVREHLNQIEEQLRSLSRELRPRILEDLGLAAALEFLGNGVTKRTGTAVTTEVLLEERLPPLVETTLYRLVQEALTNASRHANAKRVTVRLARDDGRIHCTVRDDGVGFNVPEIFARRGDSSLGLIGIRDRLEALGGTLQIDSIPGKGTRLDVRIPLER